MFETLFSPSMRRERRESSAFEDEYQADTVVDVRKESIRIITPSVLTERDGLPSVGTNPGFSSQNISTKKKSPYIRNSFSFSRCGERGIRTPGTSRYNGFQDRRIRPLCHLSAAKVV